MNRLCWCAIVITLLPASREDSKEVSCASSTVSLIITSSLLIVVCVALCDDTQIFK